MFGWELRKPSIVGLMAAISILIVLVAYTFIAFPLDNLIEIVVSLVLDIIVFATVLVVVSRDVQWFEIFSVPKFQKRIGITMIVLAVIFVIGIAAVSEDMISQLDASWLFPCVIALASIYVLSDIAIAPKEREN